MIDCTSEIGASASAVTCRPHDSIATARPIAYHLERNSSSVLRSGLFHCTSGAATAPRYFHRNPSTDATAVATAKHRPMATEAPPAVPNEVSSSPSEV